MMRPLRSMATRRSTVMPRSRVPAPLSSSASSSSGWVVRPAPRPSSSTGAPSETSTCHQIVRRKAAANRPDIDPPIAIARRLRALALTRSLPAALPPLSNKTGGREASAANPKSNGPAKLGGRTLAGFLTAALTKQSLARLGSWPQRRRGRGLAGRGDTTLVDDVLRLEAVHLVDRLHRLVGRVGATAEPREAVRRAIVEAGPHQLDGVARAAEILDHVEAAQLAVALVGDEILACADPGPGDDAAGGFADHR